MAKKRRYKKNSQKKAKKIDVVVIVLIMLSILLGVLIYTKSGYLGNSLNQILRWNDRYYGICFASRIIYFSYTNSM